MCGERERLLTQVAPPGLGLIPADVDDGYWFGPFPVGALVRISTALGGIWYASTGDTSTTKAARSYGAYLAAGMWVDYEIMSPHARYIFCTRDDDDTAALVSCWKINQVQEKPGDKGKLPPC